MEARRNLGEPQLTACETMQMNTGHLLRMKAIVEIDFLKRYIATGSGRVSPFHVKDHSKVLTPELKKIMGPL